MSRPRVIVICALSILVAPLAAQLSEADPAVLLRTDTQRHANWAAEWLRSDDPRLVAWGAWLARQDRQTALISVLIERLAAYQPRVELLTQTELDRHDAMLVVLDALIGLHAAVPVSEAHKLYPDFPAQSLILLIRNRNDAQSALLDIFHHAKANWNWLAAGNVLLRERTPGFAVLLLDRFTQHITVSVIDSAVGGGSGGGGSECGFSLRAPKTGWPAAGLYQLTQFPTRLSGTAPVFLMDRPTPVYYWRVQPGNYDNPPDDPGYCDDGNRDEYRAQYLGKLLGYAFLNPYPQISIDWSGGSNHKERLLAAVEAQRTKFREAVAVLRDSGRLLTADEAAPLKLRLELVIRDDRRDRSVPLPVVSDSDTVIQTTFSKPLR